MGEVGGAGMNDVFRGRKVDVGWPMRLKFGLSKGDVGLFGFKVLPLSKTIQKDQFETMLYLFIPIYFNSVETHVIFRCNLFRARVGICRRLDLQV